MTSKKRGRKERGAKRIEGLLNDAKMGTISDGQRDAITGRLFEPTEIQILQIAIENLTKQHKEMCA